MWAYFDNQDVWFELLRHTISEDPDWIRELFEDEINFHGAMRVLIDHGLVEVDKPSLELIESRGYSIHGCVHSWTIHVLNQEWDYELAGIAVMFVGAHVPNKDRALRPWLTQRRLLQHASRCSYIIINNLARKYSIWSAYHKLGGLYTDQGKLAEAEQMHTRALRGYEKAVGLDNIITYIPASNAIWGLAFISKSQGDLKNARKMYSKALSGYEKVKGADHPDSRKLQNTLRNLDVVAEEQELADVREPASNSQGAPPRARAVGGTPSNSKFRRLFKKFSLT